MPAQIIPFPRRYPEPAGRDPLWTAVAFGFGGAFCLTVWAWVAVAAVRIFTGA